MGRHDMKVAAAVGFALIWATPLAAQSWGWWPQQPQYQQSVPDWHQLPRDEAYRWIIAQAREFCLIYPGYQACLRPRRR